MSSFTPRLQGQAKQCKYIMTCRANGCNQHNDFTDTVPMDEHIRRLAEYRMEKLIISKVETQTARRRKAEPLNTTDDDANGHKEDS